MREATHAEIGRWDELVLANPDGGHVLQTRAWGEFKRRWGWRPHYLVSESENQQVAVLVLGRAAVGLGRLWYVPKGPGICRPEDLCAVVRHPGALDGGFVVKIDPEIEHTADTSAWRRSGWIKAPFEVQNSTATILVDLARDEDALLASFKPKCRYNIRLAARKGVRVRRVEVDDRSVDAMYRLMQVTQTRGGFMLRPKRYFEGYWRLQHASGQGEFFFALLGDEVLAACFVSRLGSKAWYKDGGSSRSHHEFMAPYLLQWEVMRWLRQRDVRVYDLVAVPRPADLTEGHPFYGLYRFKSGFNDHITEFVGTWDLPLDPRRYHLWNRAGERIARQWTYRVHHDFFY